jgi:hypothetical protein
MTRRSVPDSVARRVAAVATWVDTAWVPVPGSPRGIGSLLAAEGDDIALVVDGEVHWRYHGRWRALGAMAGELRDLTIWRGQQRRGVGRDAMA